MGPESLAGWVTWGSCDHGPLAGRKNLILNWTLTWICKGIRKFGSESFTKGGDGTSPGGILRLGLCLPAKEGVTGSGSDVEAGERIAISQKAFALCLLGSPPQWEWRCCLCLHRLYQRFHFSCRCSESLHIWPSKFYLENHITGEIWLSEEHRDIY